MSKYTSVAYTPTTFQEDFFEMSAILLTDTKKFLTKYIYLLGYF